MPKREHKMPVRDYKKQFRAELDYKNCSERFNSKNADYTKQYCSIYNVRLAKMRQILSDRINEKWGDEYPICRLHELSVDDYPKCIVIGTLFKDQKLKPSVLKQLAEANQLVPHPVYSHFTDESDVLYIEDELQRFQLFGELTAPNLVTGISCALLGFDLGKGKFQIEDYLFADYRPQIAHPLIKEDAYIIFMSGLDLIHVEKSLLSLQLLYTFLSGGLNKSDIAQKIIRVVIAGNSIRSDTTKTKPTIAMTSRTTESKETIDSVRTMDAFLLKLCKIVDVDVMPGEHDPSNHVLPQKSMHHCMFPKSAIYKSMNNVSNPYECEIGGCRMLGSSGQPVTDVLRFCDIAEPIDVLESCLKWNHIAPTAPDTLGCFPYYDNDPFIIQECPHVFFAGNQDKFDTKLVTGDKGQTVRLICVPEFSNTFTVAVLNIKDLSCVPRSFNVI